MTSLRETLGSSEPDRPKQPEPVLSDIETRSDRSKELLKQYGIIAEDDIVVDMLVASTRSNLVKQLFWMNPNADRPITSSGVVIKTTRSTTLPPAAASLEDVMTMQNQCRSAPAVWEDISRESGNLVMNKIDGIDLEEHFEQARLQPLEWKLCLSEELLSSITEIHSNDIAHRDIKPANLQIGRDGRVYVVDFGLAQYIQEPKTGTGVSGTIGYLSPEAARDHPNQKTDVFSAGCVLYRLMAKKR